MSTTLDDLADKIEALTLAVNGLRADVRKRGESTTPAGPPTGQTATPADLDGPHGDPEIRKDPPRWDGPSMVGRRYSQCPAVYLDNLAGFLDWKAGKNAADPDPQKRKYAEYDARDAGRARGWAARIRASNDIPF